MIGPWHLVTFRNAADARDRAGVLTADGTVHTHALLDAFAGLAPLIDRWTATEPLLRQLSLQDTRAVREARVLAPIRFPRKVVCAGANYRAHLQEMLKVSDVPPGFMPFFFLKPPTTTVIGPGEPIAVPEDGSWKVDWEAELVVVIGRGGRNIPAERALEHVAGYMTGNDVSARGRFFRDNPPSPAFKADWVSHKAMDRSMPIGPAFVPHWMVADPHRLRVRLTVNGVVKQDSATSDMIVGVAELVAAASRTFTLEPGDIIPTGTPAGVGIARGESLKPGDVMITEIEGLGRLENPIVAAD